MKQLQLPLFGQETAPVFRNRNRVATTFRGKLEEPVHRWFRLTPSFSPQLARDLFDRLDVRLSDRVLDPYSGTGTVPLEARRRGNNSAGTEINPALFLVSKVKTGVYDPCLVERDLGRFRRCWESALAEIGDPVKYLAAHPELIPGIAHPDRWWAPGTLAQLASARLVLAQKTEHSYPDLVRFAIASIVIDVSAAKHNHPSMSFAHGPAMEKEALAAFDLRCRHIIEDVSAEPRTGATVNLYRGNTKELATLLAGEEPFDVLVTSPPYPNRFSYARETRPLLFFLDLVRSASEVGDIEVASMGGTWGKATWLLQKPVAPQNAVLERLLAPFVAAMATANPILKHYVVRYFNDLWTHAEQISEVMATRARMAWVVGNAKMADNEVETDRNLAVIFAEMGWRCDEIVSMRKRHSKRGLRESVVFLSRG